MIGKLKAEKMIFPRYHYLDVVTKLLADVKKNGSGKSNSIPLSLRHAACSIRTSMSSACMRSFFIRCCPGQVDQLRKEQRLQDLQAAL